jgi:hypothetical protein
MIETVMAVLVVVVVTVKVLAQVSPSFRRWMFKE